MRICFFILVCFLTGCVPLRYSTRLAKVSYNDKRRNYLTVNRIPEYGDGKRDGCIIMNAVFLSLTALNDSVMVGEVRDVETLQPLADSEIKLSFFKLKTPTTIYSDAQGDFSFQHSSKVMQLMVTHLGHQSLVVDFNRKRIIH